MPLLWGARHKCSAAYHTSKFWTSPKTFYYLLVCLNNHWMSSKQCRPWSDATHCRIWSVSTLFAQAVCLNILGKYNNCRAHTTHLTHCVLNRLSHMLEESNFNFRYIWLWDLHIPRKKWLNYLQTVETLIRCRSGSALFANYPFRGCQTTMG